MAILAIRTDKPEAELHLLDEAGNPLGEHIWHADRELANQLLSAIENFLNREKITFSELKSIIVYRGPGSFTGLRIGVTVANALGYSLGIPITGAGGDNWQSVAATSLLKSEQNMYVVPEYGAPPHITVARK